MQTTRLTVTLDEMKFDDRPVDLPHTIVRAVLATDTHRRKRLLLTQRGRKGHVDLLVPRWVALDVDRPVK